jgi:hypothetical protein
MANILELKRQVLEIIKDTDYSVDAVMKILEPISTYTQNQIFIQHITQIVDVIITDRNGDKKFNAQDLEIMSKDPMALTTLATALLLAISSIPNVNININKDDTETLVFKVLAYVFLIVVPNETNIKWTFTEKENVLNITLSIYQFIKSSQLIQNILAKIKVWFNANIMSKICITKKESRNLIAERHLLQINADLSIAMDNVRDKSILVSRISQLEGAVESLKSKEN